MYEHKLSTKSASGFVRYNGKIWPDPNSKDEMDWMHEQLHKVGLARHPLFIDNDIHQTLISFYSNPNTNEKVRKIKDRWRSKASKAKSNKIQLNLSISKQSYKEIDRITRIERKTASDFIEELLAIRLDFDNKLQTAIENERNALKAQKEEVKKQKELIKSKTAKAILAIQTSPFIPDNAKEIQSEISELKNDIKVNQKRIFKTLNEFENILQGKKDIKET